MCEISNMSKNFNSREESKTENKEEDEAFSTSNISIAGFNSYDTNANQEIYMQLNKDKVLVQKEEKRRPTLFKKRRFKAVDFNAMEHGFESHKNTNVDLIAKSNKMSEVNEKATKTSFENATSQKVGDQSESNKKLKTTKKYKKNKSDKDKRPKHPMNAYNFFFQEERKKIISGESLPSETEKLEACSSKNKKTANSENGEITFEEIGKLIGKRWKQVSVGDKERYNGLAADDLERYRAEMQKYRSASMFDPETEDIKETKNANVADSVSSSEMDSNQELMNEILKSSSQARETLHRHQPTAANFLANNILLPEMLLNSQSLIQMPQSVLPMQQLIHPSLINALARSTDNSRGQITSPLLNPSIQVNSGSQLQNVFSSISSLPPNGDYSVLINALNHQQALHALQLQQIQNQQHVNTVSLIDQLQNSPQNSELLDALRNILSQNGT